MLVYIISLLVICLTVYNVSALGLSFTYTLTCIVLPIIFLTSKGMILKKAGIEYWRIFIPFYGTYTLFETFGLNKDICGIAAFINIYPLYDWISRTLPDVPTISDLISSTFSTNNPICVTFIILLIILALTNFITSILLSRNLAKCFGKSIGFAIALVLLPFLAYPILAFDDSKYCSLDDLPLETE